MKLMKEILLVLAASFFTVYISSYTILAIKKTTLHEAEPKKQPSLSLPPTFRPPLESFKMILHFKYSVATYN